MANINKTKHVQAQDKQRHMKHRQVCQDRTLNIRSLFMFDKNVTNNSK